ncbi:methyltransferase domain-containing protein [Candidatus Pelagibacter sp.]|jgi:tRNA (cmo5U34)-methyltransferase|nr:methyltransferase domain-containing protein [Candidatus Pelagibacter sp.]|tara:strand:- start:90 stop:821 length:732 start_codon:yes stop_codon:yes gene_type:complete
MKNKKISFGKGLNSIEGESWVFNKNVAKTFDLHVKQSLPFYDSIQKYISILSEWFIKDNSNIYDLGCSTGETAKNIFEFNRKRKIKFNYVGLDNSPQMIKLAKQKIKNKNIRFKTADINKVSFKKNSDLFICLLTFPFLKLNERKKLLKNVYNSLKVGGSLIFVDKIYSENPLVQDIFTQILFDSKIENKLTTTQILNKAKSLRGSMNLYQQPEIIKFCQEAGFKKNDVFFKWFNFVAIISIK